MNSNKFTITYNQIKCDREFNSFGEAKKRIEDTKSIFTSLHAEVWRGKTLHAIYDSEKGWQEVKGYCNDSKDK